MIVFDSVVKRYGRSTVLRGLSLTVKDGNLVGVKGINGSGKSTALRIACGLRSPDCGRVDISVKAGFVGPLIGASLDGIHPPGGSRVSDVIARAFTYIYGRIPINKIVRTLAHDARIDDVVRHRCSSLSTGQMKRLTLCVAFLGEPGNLILDEPFNGLDSDGSAWVISCIRRAQARGAAVLIAGHQLDQMQLCFDNTQSLDVEGL